jgi:hypothetical protein
MLHMQFKSATGKPADDKVILATVKTLAKQIAVARNRLQTAARVKKNKAQKKAERAPKPEPKPEPKPVVDDKPACKAQPVVKSEPEAEAVKLAAIACWNFEKRQAELNHNGNKYFSKRVEAKVKNDPGSVNLQTCGAVCAGCPST